MVEKDDWEEMPHLDINPGNADPDQPSFNAKRFLQPGTTEIMMRMESIFPNIEPNDMWALMCNEQDRIKWDVRYVGPKILGHNEAENSTIIHALGAKPPLAGLVVAQRDFVIEVFKLQNGLGEGRHLAVGKSVEHPEAPPANGWFDYVRMTIHL